MIENSSQLIENEVSQGEYYSFMEEDNFEIIKNKIFKWPLNISYYDDIS